MEYININLIFIHILIFKVNGLSDLVFPVTQPTTSKAVVVPSAKKVSPRTNLTNPAKVVTFSKDPTPHNSEGQAAKSSFKEDGYMSAYRRQAKK